MKRLSFFFIAVFMLLSINMYGQDVYTGKFIGKGEPCFDPDIPPVPCLIWWLETTSSDYILSINSHWIVCEDYLIFDGVEYEMDDEVEITGTISSVGIDIYSVEHFQLEIESIKKITESIVSSFKSDNLVYYDATSQVIVIDKSLQNQSLTLEVYNRGGKRVLIKENAGNTTSVADLPNGIYVYGLLKNKRIVYSGKILKNN